MFVSLNFFLSIFRSKGHAKVYGYDIFFGYLMADGCQQRVRSTAVVFV